MIKVPFTAIGVLTALSGFIIVICNIVTALAINTEVRNLVIGFLLFAIVGLIILVVGAFFIWVVGRKKSEER